MVLFCFLCQGGHPAWRQPTCDVIWTPRLPFLGKNSVSVVHLLVQPGLRPLILGRWQLSWQGWSYHLAIGI